MQPSVLAHVTPPSLILCYVLYVVPATAGYYLSELTDLLATDADPLSVARIPYRTCMRIVV